MKSPCVRPQLIICFPIRKSEFSKKRSKSLSDFFGLISVNEGDEILNDLEKIKNNEIKLLSKRIK